ncbi:carboxypeptidase-like regulatory domain-containing protein [Chitinophaga sp. CF418]|uniref:carboxypeptidase-like regulatory domain-containing protein n=1 Tax=Chitinophaga sp. CF418 TaxID=1855287 RepID=UPI000910ADA3|nr:carboxypeptidase-like regulatory domain-containing protein [Chitinophaga sp. CF418]SHN34234.1 hypothetical protein SAMN05216311_109260 [Chitinophaga sp. CF418]
MILRCNLILLFLVILPVVSFGQVLKGRLLFSNGNPVKNIKVIIAPRNRFNQQTTGSENFFYGDDPYLLSRMNAVVAVTNEDGYYYFNNIRSGRYILRVCERFGIVYNFKITDDNYDFKLIPDKVAFY